MKLDAFFQKFAKKKAKGVGKKMLAEMVKSISTPYPPASSPGNPPHRRSGKLIKAVKNARVRETANSFVYSFSVPYLFFLEYGTKRMKPRPFFAKAIEKGLRFK